MRSLLERGEDELRNIARQSWHSRHQAGAAPELGRSNLVCGAVQQRSVIRANGGILVRESGGDNSVFLLYPTADLERYSGVGPLRDCSDRLEVR